MPITSLCMGRKFSRSKRVRCTDIDDAVSLLHKVVLQKVSGADVLPTESTEVME